MSNDSPVSTIREQALTTAPFTPDSTLVDDTVALVDSTTALVGGEVSIIEGLQTKVEVDSPSSKINVYR